MKVHVQQGGCSIFDCDGDRTGTCSTNDLHRTSITMNCREKVLACCCEHCCLVALGNRNETSVIAKKNRMRQVRKNESDAYASPYLGRFKTLLLRSLGEVLPGVGLDLLRVSRAHDRSDDVPVAATVHLHPS